MNTFSRAKVGQVEIQLKVTRKGWEEAHPAFSILINFPSAAAGHNFVKSTPKLKETREERIFFIRSSWGWRPFRGAERDKELWSLAKLKGMKEEKSSRELKRGISVCACVCVKGSSVALEVRRSIHKGG